MKIPLLEVNRLGVRRNGRDLLQDVTFTLNKMETLSIIGARGAGKGLLIKALLGIQSGERLGELKLHASGKMGLVSKAYTCIDSFTVFQNLSLVSQFVGVYSQTHLAEEIEEALKTVGLWGELKTKLHSLVGELSDFQKIRLDLARTLLLKPSVLLLDKATEALDPEKKSFYETLIEKIKLQSSVIWVNHDLEQAARISDSILFLKDGKMVEFGSCEKIFTMPTQVDTENFICRRVYV